MSEWTCCPRCGTLIENLCACRNCEPDPNDPEPCDHDWRIRDDSFDHAFGTERVVCWECEKCGEQKPYRGCDNTAEPDDVIV